MQNVARYPEDWLPSGKKAGICLSIDDIHPGKSSDYYEAGGDRENGVLGNLSWLLDRHPKLRATAFTTADWREISPRPTRRILAAIPYLRDRVYLAKTWPKGTMRLDRHSEFVEYLKKLPRTEIGFHGLHHCHKGLRIPIEFQEQSREEFSALLKEVISIFRKADIPYVPGICPPGWNSPPSLLDAMVGAELHFVGSARDLRTPVSRNAMTNMHGMKNVSLIYPQWIHNEKLLHITSNFSCTNHMDRAFEIIEAGGLLSIKAHAVKRVFDYVADDGLDLSYRNFLDLLLSVLEDKYGDALYWTSMGDISQRAFKYKNSRGNR
ncbi:MAG: DUF2334 domain-containing protein [Syntrophorhabdaceae bacterium]